MVSARPWAVAVEREPLLTSVPLPTLLPENLEPDLGEHREDHQIHSQAEPPRKGPSQQSRALSPAQFVNREARIQNPSGGSRDTQNIYLHTQVLLQTLTIPSQTKRGACVSNVHV